MIRAVLFVIALAAGGAALWFFLQRPAPEPVGKVEVEPLPAPEPEMITVLAASRDLAAGDRLTRESIGWTDWPQDFMLPAFIRQDSQPEADEEFVGWSAREPFDTDEPLRRVALREPGPNPLSELLAPGMRAIAVRVTIEATAGGFIIPGDRVDVIHTRTPSGADHAESRIIASNVRVIALDQTTQRSDEQSILVQRTATLELDRDQVERVTAAEQTGNLSLALRSLADEDDPPFYPPPSVRILRGGE